MRSVSELLEAYKATVKAKGSRSILANQLLRELVEARNKGLKREVRAYRKAKRKAA